jgi:cytochrome c oxidase cbb3-type subunit 3
MNQQPTDRHDIPGIWRPTWFGVLAVGAVIALLDILGSPWTSYAQDAPAPAPPTGAPASPAAAMNALGGFAGGEPAANLLGVPVSNLYPGKVTPMPDIVSPVAGDAGAPARGQKYFNQFNCVGCHAANGAGGMGPALSNRQWIYGSSAANIYLTIYQGRPKGMPAWGGMLPDSVIWDLVAYIQSISKAPATEWGKTTSPGGFTIEQVPAENLPSTDPWSHVEQFSYGSAPAQHGEPAASAKGQ